MVGDNFGRKFGVKKSPAWMAKANRWRRWFQWGLAFTALVGAQSVQSANLVPLPQATPQPWDSIASLPCVPESDYITAPVTTNIITPSENKSTRALASDSRSASTQSANSKDLAATPAAAIDPGFCADWNPDFGLRGVSCCGQKGIVQVRSRRKRPSCGPMRAKSSYCDERTPDQVRYQQAVVSGKTADPLRFLELESQRRVQQSYCSVGDGFLAWGKPIIGTSENRILVKNPERCVNYGTNAMVGVLEWLGRQVADRYQGEDYEGVRLVVGNLSAPRGGCLSGMSGKRGHSSHTSGRDADLALFSAKRGRSSPEIFQTYLDPEPNFWLLQEAFSNPVACVKVVFLDKRHIRTLAKWASKNGQTEAWSRMSKYIKHVRGHRNHIHIRVGDVPGPAGCMTSEQWDTEDEDEGFEGEPELEADDSEGGEEAGQLPGEVADILRSMGARPLKPQESKLKSERGEPAAL
jgi:murein endopeptidase